LSGRARQCFPARRSSDLGVAAWNWGRDGARAGPERGSRACSQRWLPAGGRDVVIDVLDVGVEADEGALAFGALLAGRRHRPRLYQLEEVKPVQAAAGGRVGPPEQLHAGLDGGDAELRLLQAARA